MMAHLREVLLAQAEQRRAVEFGVAADPIIRVRMEVFSIAVLPGLFRCVLALDIDGARAPIVLFTGHVIASLQNKNALARRGDAIGQSAASCSAADNNDVE